MLQRGMSHCCSGFVLLRRQLLVTQLGIECWDWHVPKREGMPYAMGYLYVCVGRIGVTRW